MAQSRNAFIQGYYAITAVFGAPTSPCNPRDTVSRSLRGTYYHFANGGLSPRIRVIEVVPAVRRAAQMKVPALGYSLQRLSEKKQTVTVGVNLDCLTGLNNFETEHASTPFGLSLYLPTSKSTHTTCSTASIAAFVTLPSRGYGFGGHASNTQDVPQELNCTWPRGTHQKSCFG
jgi:hypothetical protein